MEGTGMDNLRWVQTGTSLEWVNAGRSYQYINAFQNDFTSAIAGSDIEIATIWVVPTTGYAGTTGYIDFYLNSPNYLWDDSNITVGTGLTTTLYPTQYQDGLWQTIGSEYELAGVWCGWTTYITSWSYNTITHEDQWYDYIEKTFNFVAGIPFWYPWSYPGDTDYNYVTQTDGWTAWTNTGVTVTVTADKVIRIDNLDAYTVDNNDYTISKQLIFNDNIYTGLVFENYWTYGDEYRYYGVLTGKFMIDIFWIDREVTYIDPLITTGDVNNTDTQLVLSGLNSGYVQWSYKDDEFKLLNFSGTNPADVVIQVNQDEYNDYLNTTYVQTWTNVFKMSHNLTYQVPWSGTITYIDRAGNTGYLDIKVPIIPKYTIKVWPQNRGKSWTGFNYATDGIVLVYNQGDKSTPIVSGWVQTNSDGLGYFVDNTSLSGVYDVDFQGLSTHLQSLTWVLINEYNMSVDFTSGAIRKGRGYVIGDSITYSFEYINSGGTLPTYSAVFTPNFVFSDVFFASQSLMISNVDNWYLNGNSYMRDDAGILPSLEAGEIQLNLELQQDNSLTLDDVTFSTTPNMTIINSGYDVVTQLIAGDLPNGDGEWDQCINLLDSAQISSIMFNETNPIPPQYNYAQTDFNGDGKTNPTDFALYLVNQFRWDGCMGSPNGVTQ